MSGWFHQSQNVLGRTSKYFPKLLKGNDYKYKNKDIQHLQSLSELVQARGCL